MQEPRWRLCSQMDAPPQLLHWLRMRSCSQIAEPRQLLHLYRSRSCSQMAEPRQLLHWVLRRLCSQMDAPPQLLHLLFMRPCSQMEELTKFQTCHFYNATSLGHGSHGCRCCCQHGKPSAQVTLLLHAPYAQCTHPMHHVPTLHHVAHPMHHG